MSASAAGKSRGTWTGPKRLLASAALAVLTIIIFWPATRNSFFDYDDPIYVTANPVVNRGFTADAFRKAFTFLDETLNWHPLTWLSHQADVQCFGLDPAGHHLTNILLHGAAAALLCLALSGMTGSLGASAAVTTLWAFHPLRVESVAWISERKDVLSGFLFMTILLAYLAYVRRPSAMRYGAVMALYLLGLASKPMLATVPVVLLLLDFWPLGRMRGLGGCGPDRGRRFHLSRLLAEKIPLLCLAAASAALTFAAQQHSTGFRGFEAYPLGLRVPNAVVSYLTYVVKMVWPVRLSFFYPYQVRGVTVWKVAAAGIILASVSALAFRWRKRQPFLAAGWFWYLLVQLPASGLIRPGDPAIADRYTYLPSIGICILAAWGIPVILGRAPAVRILTSVLLGAGLVSMVVLTRAQIVQWRDTASLLRQALRNTEDNWLAHLNLGVWLGERGELREAMPHFLEAVRINPFSAGVRYNLGTAYLQLGRSLEAEEQLRISLKVAPADPITRHNLGLALLRQGKFDAAIGELRETVRQAPWLNQARLDLDLALRQRQLRPGGP